MAGASPVEAVVSMKVVVGSSSSGVDFPGCGGGGCGGGAAVQIVLKDGFFTTKVSLLWIFSHASLETYRWWGGGARKGSKKKTEQLSPQNTRWGTRSQDTARVEYICF